jgi:hypothetical protein
VRHGRSRHAVVEDASYLAPRRADPPSDRSRARIEPLIYPAGFGSLPGYAFTKTLGIHAFVVPYGNADAANHAPNENLTLECFFNGIRTGAALLDEIGRQVLQFGVFIARRCALVIAAKTKHSCGNAASLTSNGACRKRPRQAAA